MGPGFGEAELLIQEDSVVDRAALKTGTFIKAVRPGVLFVYQNTD